ncbi:MAG: sigma-54-dependent transcriptional regulator [bacterium]
MKEIKILVVEDDRDMADKCHKLFKRSGYQSLASYSGSEALKIISNDETIGIVLADLKMPKMDGIELLRRIKALRPEIEVIIMTGYGTIQNAVQSIKIGAADYITKPFNKDELLNIVDKIFKAQRLKMEVLQLRSELHDKYGFKNIIGKSKKMAGVLKQASFAAQSDSAALILGESGTGKDLIAKAIHYGSSRAQAPFVPVNCGALPKDLIESELFGHTKGAYTGANRETMGLFRSANKGTIFLDEVVEMPKETQVKLLRVLQEKRIRSVGDTREIPIDVRVISATNRVLSDALEKELLRKDLYYRLSVVVIEIPPLRERVEDIPFLVGHFVDKFKKVFRRDIEGVNKNAVNIMMEYSWPGNIRELENVIERLFVMGIRDRIKASDVTEILKRKDDKANTTTLEVDESTTTLGDAERQVIERALKAARGNKSKAAAILGISRTRLYKKLQLYNLEPPR